MRGAHGQPIEVVGQRDFAIEVLDQTPLPGRREIKRGDQRRKQPDVAGADVGRGERVMRRGLEPERQHLGIGGCGVGAPEGFDAGLQKFARLLRAMAKNRTEIAVTLGGACCGRGEIVPRNRDGEVRTKT